MKLNSTDFVIKIFRVNHQTKHLKSNFVCLTLNDTYIKVTSEETCVIYIYPSRKTKNFINITRITGH